MPGPNGRRGVGAQTEKRRAPRKGRARKPDPYSRDTPPRGMSPERLQAEETRLLAEMRDADRDLERCRVTGNRAAMAEHARRRNGIRAALISVRESLGAQALSETHHPAGQEPPE